MRGRCIQAEVCKSSESSVGGEYSVSSSLALC